MKLRIPASSANLGPGFDCFGLAWQLYNEIEFEPSDALRIEGCDPRFANAENLAFQAVRRTAEAAGKACPAVAIRFGKTDIPVSRGLGSSAALIVGGVRASDALLELHLSDDALLRVATEIEGHPDNVAPALFGGLTVSAAEGDTVLTRRFPLHERFHFVLLSPEFELSTAAARGVLPPSYSRADAVYNLSRTPLVLRALQDGDSELLRFAMRDTIHQPYRRSLIPGYDKVEALALASGACGFGISGAGSTQLAIFPDERAAQSFAESASAQFPAWKIICARPDLTGTVVV